MSHPHYWMREQRRPLLYRHWPLVVGVILLAFTSSSLAQTTGPPAPGSQAELQTDPVLKHRIVSPLQIPGANGQDPLGFLPDVSTTLPPPIELVLSEGVPLHVILRKPVLIQRVGEPIHAFVTEPVYAFDRVVIPEGSEVDGRITTLASPSKLKRTESYLNADFSSHRIVRLEFDTLILKDGTRRQLDTQVLPALGPVLHLETNAGSKDSAAHRAKGMLHQQWDMAEAQLKPSAIWHMAKSFASSELPYHKQKLPAGTVFEIELEHPLGFGLAVVPPMEMGALGQLPSANGTAFARLTTYLSSATAHVGTPVEAVLTRPVFSSDGKLLLPVGTALQGIVVRTRPARRLHRNGQLHFILQRVQLPEGMPQQVEMALAGIEVSKSSRIQLDSEGSTSVAGNKEAGLLATTASAGIAWFANDGDPINRGAGGGSGFHLIGTLLGLGIQSRIFAQAAAVLGAGRSFYVHFIGRGSDLILPKDTPIEVSFGRHRIPSNATAQTAIAASPGNQ
ncbi:MAG TPA: hypothetical protein VGT03_15910 [Candidatus Acidoferrales bacterium]|nr:hypothetical protein [Candidatus Acidoferrales bacterium]